MNINTMRWIDRVLGRPLCGLLTLWERMMRGLGRRQRNPRSQAPRVLLIELSEMGSMVAALPAMARARKLGPEAELYFLTFQKNRKCLDLLGCVPPENVLTLRDDGLVPLLSDAWRVLRRIRSLEMDYLVDMEVFSRVSSILTALCKSARSSGFHAWYTEGLYRGRHHTHPVQYNPYQHIGHNFLALIEVFAKDSLENQPQPKTQIDGRLSVNPLPAPEEARAAVRRILQERGWQADAAGRLILINPNGGLLPIRAWPLAHYETLIRSLLQHPDWTVAIMGIDGAVQDAETLRQAIDSPRLLDVTNAFRFDQLIPLFHEADLLITNDGGPAHFAALTPIDVMVFFGPETPALYGPLSPRAVNLYSGFACSPCLSAFNHRHSTCRDNQCLKAIQPAEVLSKAEALLASRA